MTAAVLLLVERAGNRAQLEGWVRDERGLRLARPGVLPDLVLVDGPGFVSRRSDLDAVRAAAGHGFLPVLFVVPARDAQLVTPEVWAAVDDVVTTPIRAPELRVRVARLLARRRASVETLEQAEELRRSNTDLERFAFVAAHELRSPLTVVSGFVETLSGRYRGALEDGAARLLDEALEGCRRMSALVDDILAHSRVGRSVRLTRVSTRRLLDEALAELAPELEASGAAVAVGDLPTIRTDRGLLRLVFRNLVANAVKFRRAGRTPEIEVSAERDGFEWVFCVADNGIGIPEDEALRVFEIFQRGRDGADYAGSGIGLATCRRIVEELGGRIWASPGERDGAVIRFTLPAE
jgi:signal transduction histidine kinase